MARTKRKVDITQRSPYLKSTLKRAKAELKAMEDLQKASQAYINDRKGSVAYLHLLGICSSASLLAMALPVAIKDLSKNIAKYTRRLRHARKI